METVLAESLLEISRKTHEDLGIKTYHIPFLPRCIYIEAPGIAEIQQLLKFSAYSHLVFRATRIPDDINRNFLHSTSAPDVPCAGTWVRIIQPGLYRGDLAVVISNRGSSDIVRIAIVPRFIVSKKRRGNSRPAPALLDPEFVAKFPSMENNSHIHFIQSRMFHHNGLEFLQVPSTHALKIEPRPSEAELNLFRSSFGQLDEVTYDSELLIQHAVNRAFRDESRRLWRTGDRVRILEGAFVNMSGSIHEIDELNQTVIVDFDSQNLTRVEVSMEDLERQFFIGDQVHVALGNNKGRMGSILEITDDVGTIIEGTANHLIEVFPPIILLHLLIILHSSKYYCCILRAIP